MSSSASWAASLRSPVRRGLRLPGVLGFNHRASLWFRLDSPTSYRVSQISTSVRIAVVESGSYPTVPWIFDRRHIRFCLDLRYSPVINFALSCERYLLLDVVES